MKVMTYNIRHGKGLDQKINLARIAKIITSENPHLVALQEVDQKVDRSKNIDQTKELARLTKMPFFAFGSSISFGGGKYGNAILSKFPIKNSFSLALPGREKRSALIAEVKLPKSAQTPLTFISTHFALDEKSRQSSVQLINKKLAAIPHHRIILAGDLNATPKSAPILSFLKSWKNTTARKPRFTVPSLKPSSQIDYILYRLPKSDQITQTKAINDHGASDHRPLVSTFKLTDLKASR